ncbi:MAG: T9SS type A sorting domain-containing protein, partial [Candidatus Marinimicrobia bacterium]|nr:T9SS type A sorting domain-containing protein [Candidatus Neomarinimicrobiota bacterium]
RGLILPESQNHLFYPNWEDVFGGASIPCDYQIGLNGTFAFMLGFYLGLPGLYNTETGETGVGKFGLMDQGSANLNGLVPSYPSAWEREFMGWGTPAIAQGFNDIKLNHAESGSDTTLWKIPINDNEYFLIENRYSYVRPGVTLDSIQYKIYLDAGEKDWPALLPIIADSIKPVFSPETGVMLSTPRYDIGLPGSGLLIWHIDESVIDANLATNSINIDREHRGVDLEEADGAQDLGYESQMIGASVDIGWYFDPWFAGNEGFWHLNPDYPEDDEKRIGFTGFTNPSSKSNDWAYTGIAVDSIGPAGPVMEFRIKNTTYLTGFQIYESGSLPISEIEIIPIDLDTTDNSNELLVTGKYGRSNIIFTFDENGNRLALSSQHWQVNSFVFSSFSGKQVLISVSKSEPSDTTLFVFFFEIDNSGNVVSSNRQPIPGNHLISNIISLQDGILVCTFDDQLDTYYLVKYFPDENRYESLISDYPIYRFSGKDNLVFGDTREGTILRIDPSTLEYDELGDLINPGTISMGLAYIDENIQADLVVLHSERLCLILNPLDDASEIITYDGEFDSTLAFSDIDGDGKVEIITKNSSEIYAFNEKLYLEANFPFTIPNQYPDKSFKPHVLTTDIDGDQILDVIVTLENVGILAYNYSGKLISGYPKALKNSQTDQSTLMDNDKGTFLITSNSTGSNITGCYLTDLPLSDDAWYCYGGNSSRSFFYTKPSQSPTSSATGLLDQKKTFNWPNPTKNNRTAIRYFPTSDCNVAINIYDLAGDLVKSFKETSPLINDYNEIEWNVGNIANGVYFAVVKATSGSKTESKIVKIMVIH